MIDAVKKTIRKYALLEKGDKVLVGLSGGADSMCLTHMLYMMSEELDITVGAAHLNHNIRGNDALSDAAASEKFAQDLGICFHLKSANVPEYAKDNNLSDELAGREIRYSFFEELKQKYGYTKIATAHNKNDNAETILMNFMRGTTLQGLCGIPVERDGIIRPLIETDRCDIEKYCEDNNLNYVTDKTNLEEIYTRNKIRINLIPEIRNLFNPNFVDTVTRNSEILKAENDYIASVADKVYKEKVTDNVVSVDVINNSHIAVSRRVINKMLNSLCKDVTASAVEDVVRLCRAAKTGKSIALHGGVIAEIEYDKLVISPKTKTVTEFRYCLKENQGVFIEELGKFAFLEKCTVMDDKYAIYFSADTSDEIVFRNRRSGDIFQPCGMKGRKKVKDLFIDDKIPRKVRSEIPIIEINGKIACVGKLRTDAEFVFGKKHINYKIRLIQEEISIGKETV